MKAFVWLGFLVILSGSAAALDGSFFFQSLAYSRAWYPWTCVADYKETPSMFGSTMFGEMPGCSKASYSAGYNFRPANETTECPFEELAHGGYACNRFASSGWPTAAVRQISIPEDVKLVGEDGFVIGDEMCPDEKLEMTIGNRTGEWWARSGVEDSPPIQWVDDVPFLVKRIVEYHKQKLNESLNDTGIVIHAPQEPFVDEFGIKVYLPPPSVWPIGMSGGPGSSSVRPINTSNETVEDAQSPSAGNIVCSFKQKGTDLFSGGSYPLGENEIDIESDVLCFYYLYGYNANWTFYNFNSFKMFFYNQLLIDNMNSEALKAKQFVKLQVPAIIQFGPTGAGGTQAAYGHWAVHNINYKTIDDFFYVGTIKFQKKLKVVQPTEAKLEIQSFASPPEGNEKLARLVITNTGNGKVSIDGIKSSGRERKLICDNKDLEPGQSSECIAIVDRNDRNIRLAYSEWPCGRPKHDVVAVSVESKAETGESYCQASGDCSIGEECCVNLCRPAAEGVCDDIDSDGILDTWVPFSNP